MTNIIFIFHLPLELLWMCVFVLNCFWRTYLYTYWWNRTLSININSLKYEKVYLRFPLWYIYIYSALQKFSNKMKIFSYTFLKYFDLKWPFQTIWIEDQAPHFRRAWSRSILFDNQYHFSLKTFCFAWHDSNSKDIEIC